MSTEPTCELTESAQFALTKAEQIAGAVERKLKDYKTFVRHIAAPEYSFIEIAVRKNGDVAANEKQVAYSEMFFTEMTTPEETLKRGRRILREIRIHFGLPQED